MTVLTAEAREVVASGHLGHLVTINPDGSPQVSIVWVGLDGDEIVSGHLGMRQKLRNITRDPRVVLSVEAGRRNAMGLDEYLVVRGTARVTEGGAPELLQRLAHVYLGEGVRFPPVDDPPPGYVLRIIPEGGRRGRPLGGLTPALTGHGGGHIGQPLRRPARAANASSAARTSPAPHSRSRDRPDTCFSTPAATSWAMPLFTAGADSPV